MIRLCATAPHFAVAFLAGSLGAQLGSTTSFGSGCPGSAGIPSQVETATPVSGQPLTLAISNQPGPWVAVLGNLAEAGMRDAKAAADAGHC